MNNSIKGEKDETMSYEDAVVYANESTLGGYDDWRLPNSKELQSIVDYNNSLQTTNSAAIDILFNVSIIYDMEGEMIRKTKGIL